MTEIWTWMGFNKDTGSWDFTISGTGNKIAFCGATFGSSIGVNEWNDSTHVSNDNMTVDYCSSPHMNNVKYISTTQAVVTGGVVTLSTSTVTPTGCTLRISFQEDTMNTSVSVVRFYAYDGVTPTTPPSGVKVVAFERDTTANGGSEAVNTDTTAGVGAGWNSAYGVCGSANKLIMSDETSASIHYFYLGVSASPTSVGLKTAFVFRIELDYQ